METRVPKSARRSRSSTTWLATIYAFTFASALLAATSQTLWHWFVVPTTIAGILVGVDVTRWLRRDLDVLEPRALIALFGVHLVYVVPIAHILLDEWPHFVEPARDWPNSLGVVSSLNVVGLLLYRIFIRDQRHGIRPLRFTLDAQRFTRAATWIILAGLLAMGAVLMRFGGPASYFNTIATSREDLAGSGWLLLVAESWPVMLFVAIVIRKRKWLRSHKGQLAVLFLVLLFTVLVTGGLRGSRANTVWPILLAIILVHLLVTRMRRRVLVVGAIGLTLFMWTYGLYKTAGLDVVKAFASGGPEVSRLVEQTGRDMTLLVLEDFGRAGVQAIVADRISQGWGDAPVYGETYIGDLMFLVPDSLSADGPADKVEVGTNVLYGSGSFEAGLRSSRIYGLLGQGMLNFGIPWAAFSFVPLGLFVRYATRVYRTALEQDSVIGAMIAPVLTVASILLLGSDLGNVAWFLTKHGLLLLGAVWISRKRVPGGGESRACISQPAPR